MKLTNRIGGMARPTWKRNQPPVPRNAPTVEPVPTGPPAPGPAPNPVIEAVQDMLDAQRLEDQQQLADQLAQLRQPQRPPTLPTPANTPPADSPDQRYGRFGFGDVSDLQDMLYRGLPADARKIRNVRSDAGIQAWLSAMRRNDHARMERIARELDGEYRRAGGERAGYLYGSPDATSGIGDAGGGEIVPLPLAALS